MNRPGASWPRGLASPPAPPRARSHFSVAFLLRRLDRPAFVRETHSRAVRRARYGDGDVGRSQSLRCKTSGRRTPLADVDSKHGASALYSSNLDAVSARALLPLVRDDYGARIEADVGQRTAHADGLPRATPRGRVRYQLD